MKKKDKRFQYNNNIKDFECKDDSKIDDLKDFYNKMFNLKSFDKAFFKKNSTNEIIEWNTSISSLISHTLILLEKNLQHIPKEIWKLKMKIIKKIIKITKIDNLNNRI